MSAVTVTLSPESVAAIVAQLRVAGLSEQIAPETLTCEQFAQRIGRSAKWVRARCRTRRIKTVGMRRPYLIPASELGRMVA